MTQRILSGLLCLVAAAVLLTTALVMPIKANADAVDTAISLVGRPYVWGGSGPNGFDCSGLTAFCYRGIHDLPRTTWEQCKVGTRVDYSHLQRNDLVFFQTYTGDPNGPETHVGIYVGNNQMIDANSYWHEVHRDTIDQYYWKPIFLYGVHVTNSTTTGPSLIDGRMYREASKPQVYLAVGTTGLMWIHTLDDVMYWGGWNSVIVVNDGYLHTSPPGTLPASMAGNWVIVKERHSADCFLVWNDGSGYPLNHILTMDTFNWYVRQGQFRIVPDGSLSDYKRGYDIP